MTQPAIALTKRRKTLFLDPDVDDALKHYVRTHEDEFPTQSQVVNHFLRNVLLTEFGADNVRMIQKLIDDTVRKHFERGETDAEA